MTHFSFDAVVFDLDGVITRTASVHSVAWKQMFDEFLQARAERAGEPFREFSHADDYLPYVDGKPRYKGVASFLQSRGIELPYGNPADAPERGTVCGLGNRKDRLFNELIAQGNVEVFHSTVDLVRDLRANGLRVGVASSSKNAKTVLDAAGLSDLFETRVDGVASAELGLLGKPEPDIFTTACDNLGAPYDRAVIVEDAVSGVQAGQRGNFGLVLGVAREDNARELKLNGADIVVADMAEIDIDRLEAWFATGLVEDGWSLSYHDYSAATEGTREALCTVGNGYCGTRGALEEAAANDANYPATYIAGVYNRLESDVGGRTVLNEDFVNCPNWLPMTFRIDGGDWWAPARAEIVSLTRRLDFRTGVLHKQMVVRDAVGRETQVESSRFSSMANAHGAALRYTITPLNYAGQVSIRSGLDGDLINAGVERYRQLSSRHLEPVIEGGDGDASHLMARTSQSGVRIAEAARLVVRVGGQPTAPEIATESTPGCVYSIIELEAERERPLCVEKLVAIYTSRDQDIDDPLAAARTAVQRMRSYDEVQQASVVAWAAIWEKIDIQIEGDRRAQKMLRLNLYHLMCTASPHNAAIDAGIPARGLHGEAYRGHIFWDELYILPVYDMHFPETAKAALLYRYRRLDAARTYAREHGYEGAMFPWQSGSAGREETQTLHLNPMSGEWGADHSRLQRHVSLAIAANIWQYYHFTQDVDFLERHGAEIFLEICRFWSSKSTRNDATGRYDVPGVMGPDEYHEKYPGADEGGLRNNSYTNVMVGWAFARAFDILAALGAEARAQLRERMDLTEDELERWEDIVESIRVPLSDDGLLEQFEGYFELEDLDWQAYREKYGDIGRMDRILKAEGKSPDAYKVAKQADALMTFYNLTPGAVRRVLDRAGYAAGDDLLSVNFDYYFRRTSHGSTLSRLVHAYLASLVGDGALSWRLYMEALTSDYVDIQGGTTKEGIHVGVMAGAVLLALQAYAGLSFENDRPAIAPRLPATWREMRFNVGFRDHRYHFAVRPDTVQVKIDGGTGSMIDICGREVFVPSGAWQTVAAH